VRDCMCVLSFFFAVMCVLSLLYLLRQIGSIRLHLQYTTLYKIPDDWPTHVRAVSGRTVLRGTDIHRKNKTQKTICVRT
jgi:hypothetical protein